MRRVLLLLLLAATLCAVPAAQAETVGWRHDCNGLSIGGDEIEPDSSGDQVYDVEPNVPETTGYDLKNTINQLHFAAAGGTSSGTLSCTVTVNGTIAAATRGIALTVSTPGPGTRSHIFTLAATTLTVPLPGGASFVATMPEITDGSASFSGDMVLHVLPEQSEIVLRRPPLPTTGAAADVGETTATLTATVNPYNLPASVHFAYGPAGGPLTSVTPDQPIPAGGAPVTVSAPITGLAPGTTYTYRLIAGNAVGTAGPAATADLTTTAAPAPAPAPAAPVTPPATLTPPAKPQQPLPVLAAAKAITLPSATSCFSRRSFPIHLKLPTGVTAKTARITINGKARPTLTGPKLTKQIDLRNLPKGRFTVSVRVTTTDGRTITQQRSYRTCAPKRR